MRVLRRVFENGREKKEFFGELRNEVTKKMVGEEDEMEDKDSNKERT